MQTKAIRDGQVPNKRAAMDELIKKMFSHAATEDQVMFGSVIITSAAANIRQVIYPTYRTLSGKHELSKITMRADDSIRVRLTLLGTLRPDHPDWVKKIIKKR